MVPSPYMQNITISPTPVYIPYRANARTMPPITARLPVAMLETAALELAVGRAVDVELLPEVAEALVDVVLRVERVTLELVVGLRVAEVVEFELVETTVTLDEEIEEVGVLVTTGELLV